MLGAFSKVLAFGLLLMWVFASEESCCGRRNKGRIPGRLEAYVILGVGKPPKCVIANPEQKPRAGKVDEEITIWLRAVFYDELSKPIKGREILLEVIDPLGNPVQVDQNIRLVPSVITTNDRGFNETTITLKSPVPGVFRVRATYDDKRTKAVSYSPPLLIN